MYLAWQSTHAALPTKVAPGISGGGATFRETVEQEINRNEDAASHAANKHQTTRDVPRGRTRGESNSPGLSTTPF